MTADLYEYKKYEQYIGKLEDFEVFEVTPDDEEVIVNADGGKQHKLYGCRPDLVPLNVHYEVAKVLGEGAERYGEENWKLIPMKDHLAHAQQHLMKFMVDPNDTDITHAICRLYFAAHQHLLGEY